MNEQKMVDKYHFTKDKISRGDSHDRYVITERTRQKKKESTFFFRPIKTIILPFFSTRKISPQFRIVTTSSKALSYPMKMPISLRFSFPNSSIYKFKPIMRLGRHYFNASCLLNYTRIHLALFLSLCHVW